MPELRKVSGREAVRALARLGFRRVRRRGSHAILVRESAGGRTGCVVPVHRELKIGTLKGTLRQARVSPDEVVQALRWRLLHVRVLSMEGRMESTRPRASVAAALVGVFLLVGGCSGPDARPAYKRPPTYRGLQMVVLEKWGVQQGLRRRAVASPVGLEAVRRWLDANRPWDLYGRTGAVMPAYCIILLSEGGEKDVIPVFSALDSTGRRAHSVEALQRLESVFRDYGSRYDGPVASGMWLQAQGGG